MAEEATFSRRQRGEHARGRRIASAAARKTDRPPRGVVTRETIDIAQYIADMTAQLEAMAVTAHLELLAYFLGMAKAESELFVRTNAADESSHEEGSYDPAAEFHVRQERGSFD
jgi:hypothetical protein